MDIEKILLADLNKKQREIVRAPERRILVIAGAGSGKTEVMARRIAWWIGVDGVSKDAIVAFTFTERAAEEMKFRIRRHVQAITPEGGDATLGGMYIGTIHGFCLKTLRDLRPDRYHNFDVIDEGARHALIQRGYNSILGLRRLQSALGKGQMATIEDFALAYDLLNEHGELLVEVPAGDPPHRLELEKEWCKKAVLKMKLGSDETAGALAEAAARFYAYLLCRRFLDFSTSQAETVRLLKTDSEALAKLRAARTHLVVDEVQDINPIQNMLIAEIVGEEARLTAVGDHRQAIYRFRGSQVRIMAKLAGELKDDADAAVHELTHNYRSTPRIVDLANRWADSIGTVGALKNPAMDHGNVRRVDAHPVHVSLSDFDDREDEASWIADTIKRLVPQGDSRGALHDTRDGERGIGYSDVALLLRSSTDARLYMQTLEEAGIPAVFRAGPDLFAQPEVLLFIGALGRAVELEEFLGNTWGRGLPARIKTVLGCDPKPDEVIPAAIEALRSAGVPVGSGDAKHLMYVTDLVRRRLKAEPTGDVKRIKLEAFRKWLAGTKPLRRVFPQQIYQWLLAEAGVDRWDAKAGRSAVAMFHLGQLSKLVKGIETPGWSDPGDFRYQIIALCLWGSDNGRTDEAPLLVPPDAVTISTIHGAKGLEFPVVFLADVCAQRFPSKNARTAPKLDFGSRFAKAVHLADLADNDNWDDERRLMYVALTRAERYLFVSRSGSRTSAFVKELNRLVPAVGGTRSPSIAAVGSTLKLVERAAGDDDVRLVTSFSDLRYYLECPHDFYLRKVLGFAPTIDQAFGYGRGVHNIMRAVHSDPKRWAALAKDRPALEAAVRDLIDRGLLYLRYTTGKPRDNMEGRAVEIISDYVRRYQGELADLEFDPEREFETLLEEEGVLISGAIDVVRLDDPPRVSLIDFKSGHAESDVSSKLDEEEMKLQVSLYGLAAKHELEFEPEHGLVRYLAEKDPKRQEISIPLDDAALARARKTVVDTARLIRDRKFHGGPTRKPRDEKHTSRCDECDFESFCGIRKSQGTPGKT